ncbi:MAG: restriction endonuclease subunit S [Clostridiales bacterium]|nr:restriction endonuclease subunit S [Clostridiales bacterium]
MKQIVLTDLCSLNMGQSPESTTYNEVGIGLPFFQGNADFGEIHPETRVWCSSPAKIANAGDILISVRAPIGAMNLATEQCCIGRGLAALTPYEDKCNRQYLYYAIQSRVKELIAKGTGSTFKAIGKKVLETTLIPFYSLEEQDEIVMRLQKIDSVISERREQQELLDRLVRSRFIEMFGDPVSNPMKWKTLSFRQAGARLSDGPFGSNLKSEHYTETGVRVIRLGNIGVGKFVDTDKSYISIEHYEKLKKYTCRGGEIVIGTLGEPNLRACIIPDNIEVAINKADCVHYIPKSDVLNERFVCQYINCPETLLLAAGMVHGQTRSRISSGQIAQMPIFIPPMERQEQFAAFVQATDKSKSAIQRSLDELKILKKSLMQKYFG